MSKLLTCIAYNCFAFLLLGGTVFYGLVEYVLSVDRTYVSVLIFLAVLVSIFYSLVRIKFLMQIKQKLDTGTALIYTNIERENQSTGAIYSSLNTIMVTLGIIGTLVGFIIATKSIEVGSIADINKMISMTVDMLAGIQIALITTLVGSIAYLWNLGNSLIVGLFFKEILNLNDWK